LRKKKRLALCSFTFCKERGKGGREGKKRDIIPQEERERKKGAIMTEEKKKRIAHYDDEKKMQPSWRHGKQKGGKENNCPPLRGKKTKRGEGGRPGKKMKTHGLQESSSPHHNLPREKRCRHIIISHGRKTGFLSHSSGGERKKRVFMA